MCNSHLLSVLGTQLGILQALFHYLCTSTQAVIYYYFHFKLWSWRSERLINFLVAEPGRGSKNLILHLIPQTQQVLVLLQFSPSSSAFWFPLYPGTSFAVLFLTSGFWAIIHLDPRVLGTFRMVGVPLSLLQLFTVTFPIWISLVQLENFGQVEIVILSFFSFFIS